MIDPNSPLVLVTGATGYIGGRLVSRLTFAGYRVRCLVRDPSRTQGRPWTRQVEIVKGDARDYISLKAAMEGVELVYYLIHSLHDGADFHQRDLLLARYFSRAAKEAHVKRIIYLGGLGDPETTLSPHLRSRHEVGNVLRGSGVPVTEFRAAVIVGSGGASFELIRYISERMPIILCPSFLSTRVQPIGLRNVIEYLIAAIQTPESADRIIDIGGSDLLTYKEMIQGYVNQRGLRRSFFSVPFIKVGFCARFARLIAPIPSEIVRPLLESLRNEVIVRDDTAEILFPHIRPMGYLTVLQRALYRLDHGQVETAWTDALVGSRGDMKPAVLTTQEGMIIEQRQLLVKTRPAAVYMSFCGLGGKRGWLYFNWVWRVRGVIDSLVGGVGLRRGRRHPNKLRVGDALDFFRVEAAIPGKLLRLRAEMRVPGDAWFQFEARAMGQQTLLKQTAYFAPKGVLGLVYWYLLYPIHSIIFSGLIQKLAERAEKIASRSSRNG